MAIRTYRAALPLVLSLAIAAGTAAPRPAEAQSPPKELHLVDGHWTAWDPPREFPQGARLHVIERGDTLWGLAERFYGDSYLWPQLWERNRYIVDAHWIYPGDPLVLGIEATPIEEIAEVDAPPAPAAAPQEETGLRLERFVGAPVPLGSDSDIQCSGFIGALDEPFPNAIIGSEYENLTPRLRPTKVRDLRGIYGRVDTVKYDLSPGDIVYVDGGAGSGLYPGSVFTVIAPGDRVQHPVSGELIGRYYDYHGTVRILSVQDETAIAEIVYSCEPINVGSMLRPYVPEPVPLGRRLPMRGVNDPVPYESLFDAPAIVYSNAGLVSMGEGQLVFIDRGQSTVAPGDVFTIYRESTPGLPPVVVGELAVLTASDRAAVARILESRHTIYIGDRLTAKVR